MIFVAHQSLIWARVRHTNMLRSALRAAFDAVGCTGSS
jgi:hypothetical protein